MLEDKKVKFVSLKQLNSKDMPLFGGNRPKVTRFIGVRTR